MNPWDLLMVGVTQGCIYGLIAIGFVLIYKSTEIINFAQGDLAILGAFLCISLQGHGLGFFSAILLTIFVMAVFSYGLDSLLIRKLYGFPQFSIIIATIAIGLVIRAVIGAVWGYEPRSVTLPISGSMEIMGVAINVNSITLILSSLLLCLLLNLFFKSKWGLALRAASQNQLAAYFVGIPVQRLFSLSWAIGAMVATVAGILLASSAMVDPHTGLIGLKAFAAAVIGGLGSLPGAMVGGLIVGLSEQLAAAFLPAGSQEVAAYVVMLMVLLLKPHGVFSQIQVKKA